MKARIQQQRAEESGLLELLEGSNRVTKVRMDRTQAFVSVGAKSSTWHGRRTQENACKAAAERPARLVMLAKKKQKKEKSPQQGKLSVRGFGGVARPKSQDDGEGPLALSRDESIEKLYQWLRRSGAAFGRVAVGVRNGRRGIFALGQIGEGETICSIPKDAVLVLGTESTNPAKPANALLNLVKGQGPEHDFFRAMIDVLPEEKDCDAAIFFSDAEIEALEYPEVKKEVEKRREQLKRNYGYFEEDARYSGDIDNPIGKGILYTVEELQWAVFIIVSRALGVQNEDGEFVRMLIPLIDMFNHKGTSKHKLKYKDNAYTIVAGTQIEPGEEVCIVYGDGMLTNFQLLLDYGFVEEDNPNDSRRFLGGDQSERTLRKNKDALTTFLIEKLESLNVSPEDDEKILSNPASHSSRVFTIASFRREHRRNLRKALDKLQAL
mmetsp:Transcript_2480/g.7404  ORF Transcript_2480/g.7404 Transcript_2480/m.7404 type:complete len:437 (-) Transcript_2480:470-1780(-)|eukprot:CAMPEP_0198735268 /NCGR_PEP_ID=MMETSP1475-20131203/58318_1 /TAXON_ID= ORGANISM="Unidentified sp., Strain CCMP1999" /NCGR_SAMPLE_ID=MMETSP1475 /ASSEMBLY_ACC=CAM_ASM_001111 /LENGTH=436 /DNA_ID=CAMNT_0044498895 /DNA_START=787 /DNA_END=2097 /DNA_ORIENTATION=+